MLKATSLSLDNCGRSSEKVKSRIQEKLVEGHERWWRRSATKWWGRHDVQTAKSICRRWGLTNVSMKLHNSGSPQSICETAGPTCCWARVSHAQTAVSFIHDSLASLVKHASRASSTGLVFSFSSVVVELSVSDGELTVST